MKSKKYNSKPSLFGTSDLFNNIFDDFFNTGVSSFSNKFFTDSTPSINIIEEDDKFLVEVASPGMNRDDFTVTIDNDQLIIEASTDSKSEEKDDRYTRREFNYSSFRRSFYLPETIDASQVNAEYNNGILSVSLNKKEESKKTPIRQIEIG